MAPRIGTVIATPRGVSTGRLLSLRQFWAPPQTFFAARVGARRIVATLLAGVLLASGMATPTPFAVAAEPLSVPLAAMGQVESIELGAVAAPETLTLPVPDGLTPKTFTGSIEVATDQSSGTLAVYDATVSERLLSIDLNGKAGKTVPLMVPLTEAAVVDRAFGLRFEMSPSKGCDPVNRQPTTLRNLSLTFSGSESAPANIANFLPPILSDLDIYLPETPDADVRAAAVSLASAIAARYNPAQPTIRVRAGVPDGDSSPRSVPFTRSIEFSGNGGGGLGLSAPSRRMIIDGTGGALRAQIAALTNDLATIALANRAVVTQPQDKPVLSPTIQTLSDLGLGTPTASAPGEAAVILGADAAAFGGTATSWVAHLVGTVATGAQPSSSNSRGTLTATVGDRVLNSWLIPEDGRFDVTVTMPAEVLGRFAALKLTALVNGAVECPSGPPTTVTLDPRSTIEAMLAPLPLTGGFTDFPGVLRPSYQLAVDGSDIPAVEQAVAMAVSLQHLVRVRLDPQLVDVSGLLRSNMPGVLIIGGRLPEGITLPLSRTGDTFTLPDGSTLTADAAMATAQVVSTQQRNLLVVSGTRPSLVKGLARTLSDPDQLARLNGDIAIWSGTGDIATLSSQRPATPPPAESTSWLNARSSVIVALAIGVALLLAAIVAVTMVTRRRRGGALGEPPSSPTADVGP